MQRNEIIRFTGNTGGFTLIELIMVIVILGILAVVAIPKLGDFTEGSKIKATRSELMILKKAIAGDAESRVGAVVTDPGYKGHLGYRPAQLQDLVTKPAGDPVYNKFSRMGWNGPYLSDDGSESYRYDAWGNEYVLMDTQISSNGPDGEPDTDDDIIIIY